MFATNVEFSRWGTVFAGDKLAAAIVDRVVHHGGLVEFGSRATGSRNLSCRVSQEYGGVPAPNPEKLSWRNPKVTSSLLRKLGLTKRCSACGSAPSRARSGAWCVDGVAAVVDGAVAHPVEVALRAADDAQDLAQDGQVVALAVGANQVGCRSPLI